MHCWCIRRHRLTLVSICVLRYPLKLLEKIPPELVLRNVRPIPMPILICIDVGPIVLKPRLWLINFCSGIRPIGDVSLIVQLKHPMLMLMIGFVMLHVLTKRILLVMLLIIMQWMVFLFVVYRFVPTIQLSNSSVIKQNAYHYVLLVLGVIL